MRKEERLLQYSVVVVMENLKSEVTVEIVFNIPKGRKYLLTLKVDYTYFVL